MCMCVYECVCVCVCVHSHDWPHERTSTLTHTNTYTHKCIVRLHRLPLFLSYTKLGRAKGNLTPKKIAVLVRRLAYTILFTTHSHTRSYWRQSGDFFAPCKNALSRSLSLSLSRSLSLSLSRVLGSDPDPLQACSHSGAIRKPRTLVT
jgi:hypothetical protein